MMSAKMNIGHYVVKPSLVGLLTGLISIASDQGLKYTQITQNGMLVPLSAFYGVVGAGGSLAGEFLHDFVLPQINKDEKLISAESMVLLPVTSAVFGMACHNAFFMNTEYVEMISYPRVAAIHAGGSILGEYAYSMALDNYLK
jgi:hypothetical protein